MRALFLCAPNAIRQMMSKILSLLGIDANHTSHKEKLVATMGAALGIAAVYGVSLHYLDDLAAACMVASMGASAVLLFAVPHGALSQPWPVIGGHLIPALIGVTCHLGIPSPWLAAAVAVGLAVGAMSYLRCVHPPGGATALAAVIGGPAIHELGYGYLLQPVGVNLVLLLLMAVLFNNLFPWRRYPVSLMAKPSAPPQRSSRLSLNHEDFAAAMLALDTYVDITSEELSALFEKASEHARAHQPALQIRVGACYSNGAHGHAWAVRQVIDMADKPRGPKTQVIYKVTAGADLYETGICRLAEFERWAAFEVEQERGHWLRRKAA